MTLPRVTDRHVQAACDAYNAKRKLKRDDAGYLQWADIRGDGRHRPSLYSCTGNGSAGVGTSYLRGKTKRQTIANIREALTLDRSPSFAVIIKAIHERGETQRLALVELSRRGLWLSDAQREQAGLAAHSTMGRRNRMNG